MALIASRVDDWFDRTFSKPTPAQIAARAPMESGSHVLLVSPTGTGKTLAAFLGVLRQLDRELAQDKLGPGIQALYISPLRALTYDLQKNLAGPLGEIYPGESPIRVGVRTGDTPDATRQALRRNPPHILLTTPESLCLLLSQSHWLPALARVRWIVIDEIHALAENKRGSHLSLSLERLDHLVATMRDVPPPAAGTLWRYPVPSPNKTRPRAVSPETTHPSKAPSASGPQRIGLSATVAPLESVAAFLGGVGRHVEIVQPPSAKRITLDVYTPLQREPYPPAGFTGIRLMRELGRLIEQHQTTLVFSNTRSGAESATYQLHQALPHLASQIECHHASLDRDLRLDVEDRLKRGELRAVVCSTSLELGIDIGSVDLVVLLATPKGVSKALQRTGRAGHRIDAVSRGLLMATNIGDLVECCATAQLARAGHLDLLRIPEAPLDVLAQQLVGMGCVGEWQRASALNLIRSAWPYRSLEESEFNEVLDYLAGGGASLRAQYTELFGRIHLEEATFETRAGATRQDFLQNVGTIPNDEMMLVLQRGSPLGRVEESFLRQLRPGDIFMLAGRPLKLDRVGIMECHVSPAPGAVPTIPRWGSNKFPLSNRVAHEIRDFRAELREKFEARHSPARIMDWIAKRLECGTTNAAIIFRVYAAQRGISAIPTAERLLIEILPESSPAQSRAPAPKRAPFQPPPSRPNPVRESSDQLFMASVWVASGPARNVSKARTASSNASKTTPTALPKSSPPEHAPSPHIRHYFFHTLIGRSANDALSRVVGLRLGRRLGGNPVTTIDDYGFVLTLPAEPILSAEMLPEILAPETFMADLESAIERSDLLKYHFRSAAQTGLMVFRNHFNERKSVRKLQWSTEVLFNVLVDHEPGHVLMREARRDVCRHFLDAPGALEWLKEFQRNGHPLDLREVSSVPPLSFGMYASRMKEALMVENPAETLERLYHLWWNRLS